MILPSKHIPQEQALIGVGGLVLTELGDDRCTVTALWERVRDRSSVGTFERFVLALDMLYITGAISLSDGLLERARP